MNSQPGASTSGRLQLFSKRPPVIRTLLVTVAILLASSSVAADIQKPIFESGNIQQQREKYLMFALISTMPGPLQYILSRSKDDILGIECNVWLFGASHSGYTIVDQSIYIAKCMDTSPKVTTVVH